MSVSGLVVRQVSLRLGAFALREVSFAVPAGEILVLLGANGAGKSVCLETIAGFHRTDTGRICIAGRDVTRLAPEQRRVAFMVQDFGLFPHLSVAENVAIGAEGTGNRADAAALLARFGIAHLAQAHPVHLSPGEKQRAALARAMASRPSVYLFDEPFAALDAATAEPLSHELATFARGSGAPAVFVTHDRIEALSLADRVAVIENGAIRQHGPAAEVFARPGSIAIARLLGIENLLSGCVAAETHDAFCIRVGSTGIEAAKNGTLLVPPQPVTLVVRAENVHLLPPQSPGAPNRLRARVVDLRRSGPLWRVSLDCGFSLLAYALPQTARALALAPGSSVDAEIDAAAIHLLAATPK